MATTKKITEMIAGIKTIYPYFANGIDAENIIKIWYALLKKYSDKAVEIAFYKCLQNCKTPPTPADIIEQLNGMLTVNNSSNEELWAEYVQALKETKKQLYYFNFTMSGDNGRTQGDNARDKVTDLWNDLPDTIKNYIGSKNELVRIANNYNENDLKFERNKFMKEIPQIKNREEFKQLSQTIDENILMLEE